MSRVDLLRIQLQLFDKPMPLADLHLEVWSESQRRWLPRHYPLSKVICNHHVGIALLNFGPQFLTSDILKARLIRPSQPDILGEWEIRSIDRNLSDTELALRV